jgi:hypothetical protein
LILVGDTQLRRDLQSTVLKAYSTATLLKGALGEMAKGTSNAPQADRDAAAKMTRDRFEQLRDQ